jgi:hypothetical protein
MSDYSAYSEYSEGMLLDLAYWYACKAKHAQNEHTSDEYIAGHESVLRELGRRGCGLSRTHGALGVQV